MVPSGPSSSLVQCGGCVGVGAFLFERGSGNGRGFALSFGWGEGAGQRESRWGPLLLLAGC